MLKTIKNKRTHPEMKTVNTLMHSLSNYFSMKIWLYISAIIGEENDNPLHCSCLENPRDIGAWWAAVYGVAQVRHDWSDLAAAAAGFPGGTNGQEHACQCSRHKKRVWSLGGEDPLEEEITTHSSILAGKIPRTEQPAELQSIGSQRFGHNWTHSSDHWAW